MQKVMNKIPFTDFQIRYSGEEVIGNQCIAPRDLKVKFNLELSFIYSSHTIYFIILS